jgi:hypothetical protein
MDFCEQGSCLAPLKSAIADHASDHGSVLLFHKRLVVLAVRSAAREDDVCLLAIRFQRLVYQHGNIVGIDALGARPDRHRDGYLLQSSRLRLRLRG